MQNEKDLPKGQRLATGRGIGEPIDPSAEERYWRQHHLKQWFGKNRSFDDFQGAYRTGYEGFGKYGQTGKSFDECESDLAKDYERNRGNSKLSWIESRDAARAAWHKVHGRWERLIDYEVQDRDNSKIGTVHNLWTDENGEPTFIGVKTGWFSGKNHVVPAFNAMRNDHKQIVRLPYDSQKVKDAPTFDADCDLNETDEQRIYSYYGGRPQMRGAAAGAAGTAATAGAAATATAAARPSAPGTSAPPMEKRQPTPQPMGRAETAAGREETTMQLSEEELKIGKREVAAGGVRLHKIVRTETVNQPVELRREEVVIERVPGTGAPGTAPFQEQDVFIPLRREEVVVEKQAHVREEIHAHKESLSDQQTVSEQVRREDVEVQKEGDARFATDTGKARSGTPRYEPKERSKR